MMVVLQILGIAGLVVVLALLVVYAIYQSVPKRIGYIPLPHRAVAAVIEALALPKDTKAPFVDLGCGDGRVLQAALQSHPKMWAQGVEINPIVAFLARWRLRSLGERVQIVRGDLFKTDIHAATYVFTYLNPPMMAALEPKLKQELPKKARLVSCDFPLPNRKTIKTLKIGEAWQLGQTLYIYEY